MTIFLIISTSNAFSGLLLDRWRQIAAAVVVAILLAVAFLVQATPIYRATAKVLIDTRQQKKRRPPKTFCRDLRRMPQ